MDICDQWLSFLAFTFSSIHNSQYTIERAMYATNRLGAINKRNMYARSEISVILRDFPRHYNLS